MTKFFRTYIEEKPERPGLYLALFHGFESHEAREDCDGDWGQPDPMIGPLKYVHTTYTCHIKFAFADGAAVPPESLAEGMGLYNAFSEYAAGDLMTDQDCVYFDGVYYGDWTVFYWDGKDGKEDAE